VSIRPTTIDRMGERPCIPNFYEIAKKLAEGRQPTLAERIADAMANLRRKVAR